MLPRWWTDKTENVTTPAAEVRKVEMSAAGGRHLRRRPTVSDQDGCQDRSAANAVDTAGTGPPQRRSARSPHGAAVPGELSWPGSPGSARGSRPAGSAQLPQQSRNHRAGQSTGFQRGPERLARMINTESGGAGPRIPQASALCDHESVPRGTASRWKTRYSVRLTVSRCGGWRAWGIVRADFENTLADPRPTWPLLRLRSPTSTAGTLITFGLPSHWPPPMMWPTRLPSHGMLPRRR
jgi:hypothetical protein